MKSILAGVCLTLLASPALAIDAWPACLAPTQDAKALWACNQVLAHGWMPKTTAAATYDHRAQIRLALGNTDSAISDATNALNMLPVAGKETEQDIKDREWAQEIRAESLAVRSAAYRKSGKSAEADADATQALGMATQLTAANPDGVTYNLRAYVLHMIGRDADALPDAVKAAELYPEDPVAIDTRAVIHEALGRRDDAVADYRAALKLAQAQPRSDFVDTYIWFSTQALQRLGEKP